jgi:phosphoglucosamine mutase
MGHLFGTDGIRGRAGEPPLDDVTVARVGAAVVEALITSSQGSGVVLLGRDTRASGPAIEHALARGVRAAGAEVVSAGVLPTPAIAYLTAKMEFTAGLVISASHNPFEDNGIKVFSGDGVKVDDEVEGAIEAIMVRGDAVRELPADVPVRIADYSDEYLEHLRGILAGAPPMRRLRVALDCANGATAPFAPRLFDSLGFETRVIGGEPDGRNINHQCGSTAPARLASTVVAGGCDLGIAYDGDGDRAIFVDASGEIVDGDAVLYLCAKHLRGGQMLKGAAVVATVMSNLGLELGLRDLGIDLLRCPVGDRHVMQEMRRRGVSLGGEQSGHIIFADDLWTGDGIGTSLHVLHAMTARGETLAALAAELVRYPQVLLNLRVTRRVELSAVPEVAAVIGRVEAALAGRGRLLVRYSGTEPLLRVMLEGQDRAEIERLGGEIIDAARMHLGAAA